MTNQDIDKLERYYRANLINSVTGYKPANLIGTINDEGITNVAIFSSIVHLGSNPALIAFVQRPLIDTSHTYKNIKANGQYTINHVNTSIVENAHYTSAKYGDGISEFDTCKLTAEYIPNFAAPFVAESVIKIGLQYVQEIPITINNTTLIIGEIKHLILAPEYIKPDGTINLEKANTIAISGLDTYYTGNKLAQYPYAKVENNPYQ